MCCSVRLPLTWRLWAGGSRGFLTPLTPQIVWWTCVAGCCITSAPHTRDVTHLCLCVYVGCTCLHVRASRLRDTSSPKKRNRLLEFVSQIQWFVGFCTYKCLCVWMSVCMMSHVQTFKHTQIWLMWQDVTWLTWKDAWHDPCRYGAWFF